MRAVAWAQWLGVAAVAVGLAVLTAPLGAFTRHLADYGVVTPVRVVLGGGGAYYWCDGARWHMGGQLLASAAAAGFVAGGVGLASLRRWGHAAVLVCAALVVLGAGVLAFTMIRQRFVPFYGMDAVLWEPLTLAQVLNPLVGTRFEGVVFEVGDRMVLRQHAYRAPTGVITGDVNRWTLAAALRVTASAVLLAALLHPVMVRLFQRPRNNGWDEREEDFDERDDAAADVADGGSGRGSGVVRGEGGGGTA